MLTPAVHDGEDDEGSGGKDKKVKKKAGRKGGEKAAAAAAAVAAAAAAAAAEAKGIAPPGLFVRVHITDPDAYASDDDDFIHDLPHDLARSSFGLPYRDSVAALSPVWPCELAVQPLPASSDGDAESELSKSRPWTKPTVGLPKMHPPKDFVPSTHTSAYVGFRDRPAAIQNAPKLTALNDPYGQGRPLPGAAAASSSPKGGKKDGDGDDDGDSDEPSTKKARMDVE